MSTFLGHPGTPGEMLADLASDQLPRRKRPRTLAINDSGHTIGETHHRARLSDADVWLIHDLRAEGVTRADIAIKFECSVYTIREILSGRRRGQIATGQRSPRRTG